VSREIPGEPSAIWKLAQTGARDVSKVPLQREYVARRPTILMADKQSHGSSRSGFIHAAKVRNVSKVGSHELALTARHLAVLPGTTPQWIRTLHASELRRPFPQPECPAGEDSKSKA